MDSQKIQVLHLASFHNTNKLYLRLMESLAKLNVDQTVVSPRGFTGQLSDRESISYHGKSVVDILDKFWFSRKVAKYSTLLSTVPDISHFNVCHAHSLYSDGAAAHKLWQTQGIPYMVTIRHTDVALFSRYFIHLRKHAREILKHASHVVFVNKNYPEKLSKLLGITLDKSKVSVIPNGVADYWFQQHANYEPNDTDPINILSVAEVLWRKNHRTLIKAVQKHNAIRQSHQPAMRLTIIGLCSGRYGKQLKARYSCDEITFTGALPFEQIAQEMGKADVFALLSKPENFGVVFAEAVTQGLPVIYTRGEGFDGWMNEGVWGYSCASDNVDEFLERSLALGKANRLSNDAIATAKDLFDWNNIGRNLLALYEEARR